MQADAAMERSNSGLGIGLALVQDLVRMHGGTVEAQSAGLGQRSEFVVRLPIAGEAPPMWSAGPPLKELANTTVRRILIVDDNRDAAESLAMLLKLTGHETHIAHDGLEAVETAARVGARPDIARHRLAEDQRLRGGPPNTKPAGGTEHGAGRLDRMGPGRRPAKVPRIGVRWSYDQAGEGRPPYLCWRSFPRSTASADQSSTASTSTRIALRALVCVTGCSSSASPHARRVLRRRASREGRAPCRAPIIQRPTTSRVAVRW
jgi:hypothetical protein